MDISINIRRLPPPENIQISSPKGPGQLVITWDMIRNPDYNLIDGEIVKVMYNIYRGISANGIFYKQNQKPLEINHYEDSNVGRNPNTQYWYKVSTVYLNKTDNLIEGQLSAPTVYHVLNNNKWFNKVNERNFWILKNTGQLFDLYTYKTEGKPCPACYDKVRGRSVNDNCSICYGTGIEDGYEPMFQLYLRQKPAQTDLSIGNQGFTLNSMPGAWTITTVLIKNRDLSINPQGQMFSVISSNVNQAAGYLFHQELQLKQLDPMDPRYKIKRAILHPNL